MGDYSILTDACRNGEFDLVMENRSSSSNHNGRLVFGLKLAFLGLVLAAVGIVLVGSLPTGWSTVASGPLGGFIAAFLMLALNRRYPPPVLPPVASDRSLMVEGNRLVRKWRDDGGGPGDEAHPLTDLVVLIEWVGFEGGFMEIVWRDGTRWRIDQWVGQPLPSYLGEIMCQHHLKLKVERRGLVLREAELAVSRR
ncbi:MAG: hypothetical protein JSR82_08300 [Verrucomicrobia bacterium]|nr:hypothetical protein [Verrucomicrobiota bacterium]MBS0658231.1 hypothetical protein [Verrucomicrobiota bacterium]